MTDSVKVEITKAEYDQIREQRRRLEEASGRMSLRIPHALWHALQERSNATGLGKTRIVHNALAAYLAPKEGLIE
ncbi:hypothetical protein [Xanthobacter autotrophicus]|uniref:hypothetical protein n=1 Tax=Xanthobacter autotrophicus TaxID=280 RepID=UPI0037298106